MPDPIDFQTVFDRIPSPYMMLDRDLRFVAANRAYLAAVGRDWAQLEGVGMFEAFPSSGESRRVLESSLIRARDSGQVDMLPLIHYAIQRPHTLGGGFEDRIWSATHTPIGGDNGETLYILQHTQDVTEIQRLKDVAFGGRALPAAMMLGDDLLRRAETVQAQSLQLRQLFMQAPGFMAVMRGPDHVFELVNNTYLQLIGHRDVVGQPIRDVLPEVVEQGFVALLDNVLRTGEAFVGRQVKVVLQRDPGGAPYERYLDFIYQPIIEDDGEISGVFLEGADITDQVRAQERQRLLVDELNHRVKNTLATVQAIAQQTLRGAATPERFAEAFEARLMALSQTHNALTDSHWTGAGLRQILWQELSPYGAERVTMQGPDVQLSARLALALGMVFHELATNAAKYGALSDGGRLAVTWAVDAADDLSLDWRETGGPPAAPPARKGFGSRLIERSITGELQGRIQLDYATTGLVCRFTVPLAREP
jgi:two-component sensor histidine kinase